jgi:hypothetical protein
MFEERKAAAEMVAGELHPLERLIDKTIARGGSLTTAMMHARVRGKLSVDQGQRALDHVTEAVQLMARARSHIVAGHRELKQTQEDIGIGTYAVGDTSLTPNTGALSAATVAENIAA